MLLDLVFLTKESGLLLGPISAILGVILNAIYEFLALFSKDGIANIALCIILFTIIVKMLMLPLTIKQQKSSKLTAKMTPELSEITAKYKGKTDEASQRKMQLETQAVYEKYGTNPMAGCLPLLISLPIMFALYRVIYAVPAYINDIGDMYRNIADKIQGCDGYAQTLAQFITDAKINTINLSKFSEFKDNGVLTLNHIIDVLSKCNADNWSTLAGSFPSIAGQITEGSVNIIRVNKFLGGLNILNNPVSNGNYFSIGVLIPILAVVTQIIQTKLMTINNDQTKKGAQDDAVAASMKSMNVVMPLMSGFICFMIPIGVGIYWIISSVVQIIQQIFINRYMDKVDVEEMIAKNQEKMAKRREKYGIATGNKMAEVAKTSTKAIDNTPKTTADFANLGKKNYNNSNADNQNDEASDSENENKGSNSSSVSGSGISAYANIMKNRNLK